MTPPRVSPVLRTTRVYAYTRPSTGAWPVGVSVDDSNGGPAWARPARARQGDAQRHRGQGRAMRRITRRSIAQRDQVQRTLPSQWRLGPANLPRVRWQFPQVAITLA